MWSGSKRTCLSPHRRRYGLGSLDTEKAVEGALLALLRLEPFRLRMRLSNYAAINRPQP